MLMSTELTMWADGEFYSRYNMSATYLMEPINSKECNVKYVGISAQVNLDTHSCTCRQFDLVHMLLLLVNITTFHVTLCVSSILLLKHCYLHIHSVFIQLEMK